jgi:hypothetical protein
MDVNNKGEINKLLGKSKEFADCLHTSILTCPDAWYALTFTVTNTLQHPMVATMLTELEWVTIMFPLLAKALPTSRMTRKYAFVVAYGPLQYPGLEIIHPYYRQEIQHINSILWGNPQCHSSQATSFAAIRNNCDSKWASVGPSENGRTKTSGFLQPNAGCKIFGSFVTATSSLLRIPADSSKLF